MIKRRNGAVAQLGEHLLCKQGVIGSIPISSTRLNSIFSSVLLLEAELLIRNGRSGG